MQTRLFRSLVLGWLLAGATGPSAQADIIGFEDLTTPPGLTGVSTLEYAVNGTYTNTGTSYDGVVWDSRIDVVGSNYEINSTGPLFSGGAPRGGNYYITNDTGDVTHGNGITLTTTQVLTGAYFGSVEYYGYSVGEGASQVTVIAMDGSTALDSLTFDLVLNTQTSGPTNTAEPMTYFNTSAFTSLTGITGYVINQTPENPGSVQYGETNWVADNFDFVNPASVPEPTNSFLLIGISLALVGRLAFQLHRVRS